MGVSIAVVMNNTGSVLQYNNTESGYKLAINPTVPTKDGKGGTISTSRSFHLDPVPSKESNHVINVTVANGGPTFTLTDDNSKFSVICDSKSQEWARNFNAGDKFAMRVDPHGMSIVLWEEGLPWSPRACEFVVKGPNLAVTEDYPNAIYAMKLRS